MAENYSGVRWPSWPVAGAVGAGRQDELAPVSEEFTLTPSGIAEQAAAVPKEVPGAEPEPPG